MFHHEMIYFAYKRIRFGKSWVFGREIDALYKLLRDSFKPQVSDNSTRNHSPNRLSENFFQYDANQVLVRPLRCPDGGRPGSQWGRCRLSFRKIQGSLCRLGQWDLPTSVQGGRTSQWSLQPQSEVLVRRMLRHQFLKIFFKVCSALQKPNI